MALYDQPVRASGRLSAAFTLVRGSSPGFGSMTYCVPRLTAGRAPFQTRFRFAFVPEGT